LIAFEGTAVTSMALLILERKMKNQVCEKG